MRIKKFIFLVICFIFTWSLVSHTLTCAGEDSSTNFHAKKSVGITNIAQDFLQKTTSNPSPSHTDLCQLGCSALHFFITQSAQALITLGVLQLTEAQYRFFYKQPHINSTILPPIQFKS